MKRFLIGWITMLAIQYCQAQIVNIEDRRANFSDTLGMFERLDLGTYFVKNDKEVFSANAGFQIEFLQNKRLFLSITRIDFLKADEENFVNSGLQHLRYNYQWFEWLTWEAFGQLQYNEQLRIRLRGLAGTGPRFSFKLFKKGKLNLGTSYMWEYDEISETDELHQDNRLNTYLSLHYKVAPVRISSTTYFQPLFDDFNDYRLSNESTVGIKLFERWNFNVTFQLNYDSRLPDDVPDLVYRLSNGLSYSF